MNETRRIRSPGTPGAADWAEPNLEYLADLRPELPSELDDRAADAWEPLLAIADGFGAEWSERARAAARALSKGEEDDDTVGIQLLGHVRRVFDGEGDDRISTTRLLEQLTGDAEARWAAWGRTGKPLGAHGLARLLSPFGIRSRTIRQGEETSKGYMREDFEDPWTRYLPLNSVSDRNTVTTGMVEPKTGEAEASHVTDREVAQTRMDTGM